MDIAGRIVNEWALSCRFTLILPASPKIEAKVKLPKSKKPPLYVAIHEAGHAVIMMFLGLPRRIKYVSLTDTPPGTVGFVKASARFDRQLADAVRATEQFSRGDDAAVSVVAFQKRAAWWEVVDLIAGNVAELRSRQINSLTRAMVISQTNEAAGQRRDGSEFPDDFVQIYERLEWLDKDAIGSNALKALEETEALVTAHWSKIRELGRLLHKTMHIDEDALIHWRERWQSDF
jgi:hypothetical protein